MGDTHLVLEVQLLVVLLLQLPREDVQVGFDAPLVGTLGDNAGAVLDGPPDQDLQS